MLKETITIDNIILLNKGMLEEIKKYTSFSLITTTFFLRTPKNTVFLKYSSKEERLELLIDRYLMLLFIKGYGVPLPSEGMGVLIKYNQIVYYFDKVKKIEFLSPKDVNIDARVCLAYDTQTGYTLSAMFKGDKYKICR